MRNKYREFVKWLGSVSVVFLVTHFFSVLSIEAMEPEKIEEAIQTHLLDRHPEVGADWWLSLGEGAPPIIIGMYQKTSHILHRSRLLKGLAHFSGNEVKEFLEGEVQQTSEKALRRESIRSLGLSQGEGSIDFLENYLSHKDDRTRLAAAEAIKRIADEGGNSRAKELVKAFRSKEKKTWLLSKLDKKFEKVKVKQLPTVSSSKDQFNPDLSGSWKGFWIFAPLGSSELRSLEASAQLILKEEGQNKGRLEGTVNLKGEPPISLELSEIKGKEAQFSGYLKGVLPISNSRRHSFRATLKYQRNLSLLEWEFTGLGARLVLAK